ncbi:ABC transporter ATP-binding protein [Bdellovibrio sp. HCB337]|uniref:ABC transporter ATP-binding protein n=1 Tax=Bdellovibrio sp. HCB337 TaxID=3394358 RepID=UPI0039A4B284
MSATYSSTPENTAETTKLFKNPLLHYIRYQPRAFFAGIFLLVITNALDGLYPLLLKVGIDQIEKHQPLGDLGRTSMFLIATLTCLGITRYAWRRNFGKFHTYAMEDMRLRIFKHFTTLGPSFFQKNQVGELMSVLTNDVTSFRQAIGPGLLIFMDGVIYLIIILPVMFTMNFTWTWQTLILLPLVPFLINRVMKLIHKNYKISQDRFSELTGVTQETIGGIRVVKSYAQEDHRTDMFCQSSRKVEAANNKVAFIDALFMPVMEFGVTSGSVILFFIAANDLYLGTVTIGTFVAFHRYIQKMVWPVTALGLGFSYFEKGRASIDRIKEVMVQDTDIPDTGTVDLREFNSLEFRNVSFKYPGSEVYVLKNISFQIRVGEHVGLMGQVGSGKSTLVNLLLRMYPVNEGQIFINTLPIEKYTLKSLRAVMVLVTQEVFLFSETVSKNISYGMNLDPEFTSVERMTHVVNIHGEIENLPQKFDSQLGERGVNLSGGQKQRLSIARGLILTSPFLILDDSLSAVDTRTEKMIEEELVRAAKKQTRITVAHRLSSLKSADKIIVLKDGMIEAMGPAEELMQTSPSFRTIVSVQSSSEVNHE